MRIITLLFIISLMLEANFAAAQNESSFGAFVAVPVGKFGSKKLADGGFAKTGWGIVFDSKSKTKYLPKEMSIYFHSTYQWNNIDNEKVSEEFSKALDYRTEISKSRYSPIVTLVGPAYDWKVSERVTVGFNTGVGIIFNNTRAFSVTIYDDNDQEVDKYTVNFDNDPAFGYLVGTEVKFRLIENLLDFSLYGDYTAGKQDVSATVGSEQIDSFNKLQYLNLGFRFVVK